MTFIISGSARIDSTLLVGLNGSSRDGKDTEALLKRSSMALIDSLIIWPKRRSCERDLIVMGSVVDLSEKTKSTRI